MRIYLTKLKNISITLRTAAALTFSVLIILYSDEVKTAAASAVNSCLNTVIPCIFPFLTVSFFILETGFPVKFRRFTDKPLKRLFGLSGNCAEAVILGLTGGYLTASKTALTLLENKSISDGQAKRTVLFFTNPGISFTVILTGITVSGSFSFGLRLYIISVSANILIAYIYNLCNKYTNNIPIYDRRQNTAEAFANAVSKSSASIISISFSIILFACITCILMNIFPFSGISSIIALLSEITSALFFSAKNYPLYIIAGILPFGGLCIFIQILPDLIKLKIKPLHYLSVRVIHGILCMSAEYVISVVFPVTEYTSIFYNQAKLNNGNPLGSAALLFLCAVYLISVKNIKTKKRHYDKLS